MYQYYLFAILNFNGSLYGNIFGFWLSERFIDFIGFKLDLVGTLGRGAIF